MSRYAPIGLDWSGPIAAAVQLRRARRGPRLHAALRLPVGPPETAPAITDLHRVLWRHGFEGSDVVLTLPTKGTASTISGALSLPPRSCGAPIDQLARAEMARVAGRPADALELEMWDIPAPRRAAAGCHVLAVAATGAEVAARVALFEDAGLCVAAADARASALCRATESLRAPGPDLTIVLELAWDAAHLVAATGDAPVFERRIDELGIGAHAASILGVSDERALERRLSGAAAPGEHDRRAAPESAAKVRRLFDALRAGVRDEIGLSASYLAHQFDRRIARVVLAAPPPFLDELGAPASIECLRAGNWGSLSIDTTGAPDRAPAPGAVLAALGASLHPCLARGKAAA
ncbi:MAG: hypothetical protein JNL50_00955 [Phycisphaerae bacterium]|nr:hypothetical protein [Phycisphaerae bacterium]